MATRALPQSAARAHAPTELGALVRHVDYLLLAAVGAVIAYGLWVLGAVTRHDVPGDSTYYVFRQEIYVAVGVVVLALVTAIDPEVYRRYARVLYGLAIPLLQRGKGPVEDGAPLVFLATTETYVHDEDIALRRHEHIVGSHISV